VLFTKWDVLLMHFVIKLALDADGLSYQLYLMMRLGQLCN